MNRYILVCSFVLFSLSSLTEATQIKKDGTKIRQDLSGFGVSIDGQVISMNEFPAGTITMDPSLKYVGTKSFKLNNIAGVEVYLYVDANKNGRVNRLYWIHYERILPGHQLPVRKDGVDPNVFDYSEDPYRGRIDGKEVFVRTYLYSIDLPEKSLKAVDKADDSDGIRVMRLLHENGYDLNTEIMQTRFVLLDKSKKKELMIMYFEALDQHDLAIESFGIEGQSSKEWELVAKAMRSRALAGMDVKFSENTREK